MQITQKEKAKAVFNALAFFIHSRATGNMLKAQPL